MNDLTPEAAPPHDPARFRAELLLQLPTLALKVIPSSDPAGIPSDEYPTLDLYDQVVPDHDYDEQGLVAWIIERNAEAYAAGVGDGEAGPVMQMAAEIAAAAGRVEVMIDVIQYLEQLPGILKRGMRIDEQWDLARTIQAEADKMRTALQALLRQFPHLAEVVR